MLRGNSPLRCGGGRAFKQRRAQACGALPIRTVARTVLCLQRPYRSGGRPHVQVAGRSSAGNETSGEAAMDNRYLFLSEGDFIRVMALQPEPALRAELERAIVVPADSIPAGVVTLYSHVRYRDEHADATRQIQIVLPEDADVREGRVSVLAPVGSALLGLE